MSSGIRGQFAMTLVCTVALFLATFISIAHASSFLSRAQGDQADMMDAELQSTIMLKIEAMLGDDSAVMSNRLQRIQDQMRISSRQCRRMRMESLSMQL